MKDVRFSQHTLDNMNDRGATNEEVELAVREGEYLPAKKGRLAYRKNFNYDGMWKGKYYKIKQVMPIVIEETDEFVVVTVYVFFIGGAG